MAGFEYGLNLSVVRSSVTSRKLTVICFYGDSQVVICEYSAYFFLHFFQFSGGV